MKHAIQWLLGLSLSFITSPLLIAQESLVPIELLTSPLPIFSEQQDSGRISGYSVEYARSLFNFAGYKPTIEQLPFSRLIKKMDKSELVVATGIARTPERESDFFWITPMTANVIGIFSIVDGTQKITTLDGLGKLQSVGVLRGDYRANILRTNGVKDIVEFNNWKQAIDAVLKGKITSIFFSELGVSITCQLAKFDCTTLQKTYTYDIQFSYMAMPKTDHNREHAIRLANAAERFIATSTFAQLVDQWLPKLQRMETDVAIAEGVITFGKMDSKQSFANHIWVLTHLEPPFSQYDEHGIPSGYAVELVQGILTEAGMHQQILVAPWQRILVESKMKSDVLVFALARTHNREENFHWISPITQNAYSIFGQKSDQQKANFNTISQLPPQSRITVLAGDFREKLITDAGYTAVTTPTWQVAVQKVLTGDADYIFLSDGGIDIICQTIEESCADITKIFQFQLATTYLAVSKHGTSQKLIEKLKNSAAKFKQTRQYQEIAEHWIMDNGI